MSTPPDGPEPRPEPNEPQPTPPEQHGDGFTSAPADRGSSLDAAAERIEMPERNPVLAPAIGLIVLGVLSLLWALYETVNTLAIVYSVSGKQLKEQMDAKRDEFLQQNPGQAWPLPDWSADEWKNFAAGFNGGLGGLALITTVILTLGGVRMMQLRSYGLCIFASITAMVPCISCTGCCFGQVVGIWAIVVLLRPEVKFLFQRMALKSQPAAGR